MMQTADTTNLLEGASQLIALLERHRSNLPFADEELARHRALRHAIDDQHRRGEHALSDWREALSNRWECEVSAQRVYTAALRQLNEYYSDDSTYARLVGPAHPGNPTTASDLLDDMRRLEASIALLNPRPDFAEASLPHLRATGDNLAAAIDWTGRCEAERRSILLEQRIASNLYQRACDKTRRLLSSLIPEAPEALAS
jgi:hypothetical protein